MSAMNILSVLTGGLAGAILTLTGQFFIRLWGRPRLAIRFAKDEPGCAVNTPAWLLDESGKPLRNQNGDIRTAQTRYLRLHLNNRGRTFAQNTSVCITRIDFRASGAGAHTFAEEVFDLKLSLTGDRAVFNLAALGHRFIDVVHTQQEQGKQAELHFDFLRGAARLGLLGYGPGQYEMTVFVAAENCKSEMDRVRWSWDGTLNGLTIDT
jgi:hypothetical protein